MFQFMLVLCRLPHLLFPDRRNLILENLALRHQLKTLQRTGKRPVLRPADRLFWIWLSRHWADWREVLQIVQPSTVVAWHRKGFRRYWTRLSQRKRSGRPATGREVRALIGKMAKANAWGAPRIHGELLKLGIDISERTVSRWMPRRPKPPAQTWKSFLANHLGEMVSIDFFTVPTVTFRVLFVFVVLAHERRRVVHFNVTEHPTAAWTAQQIIEAFPWDAGPHYLLRDRDQVYGDNFRSRVQGMDIEEVLIAPRSPWQTPYVERLIGSVRRECLDQVIVLGERHLRRTLRSYFRYYHRSRTDLSLGKDSPVSRAVQPPELGGVVETLEVGGLHHRYERRAAA